MRHRDLASGAAEHELRIEREPRHHGKQQRDRKRSPGRDNEASAIGRPPCHRIAANTYVGAATGMPICSMIAALRATA
jgi:hypothetical protein